jgi:hypothetical protein
VASSGVPVVRFKAGEPKEDIAARPCQDAAVATGQAGLVLAGKAQERTSSWRGLVDAAHASHRPTPPSFTHLAARVVVPALTDLAELARPKPPVPRPLTEAWRNYANWPLLQNGAPFTAWPKLASNFQKLLLKRG